jgi:hypothetical protein
VRPRQAPQLDVGCLAWLHRIALLHAVPEVGVSHLRELRDPGQYSEHGE